LLKGKSQTAVEKGSHQKNIILDAVKKIVTIIAVPLLLLLIFSSYTYIKNYRKKNGSEPIVQGGFETQNGQKQSIQSAGGIKFL